MSGLPLEKLCLENKKLRDEGGGRLINCHAGRRAPRKISQKKKNGGGIAKEIVGKGRISSDSWGMRKLKEIPRGGWRLAER